jgi:hypothetical protein
MAFAFPPMPRPNAMAIGQPARDAIIQPGREQ